MKEGDYYYKTGDYPGAMAIYLNLYPSDSGWAELNFKMGTCLFNTGGDTRDALGYFSRSVRNGNNEARYYSALILHRQNRIDDELKILNQYISDPAKKKNIQVSEIDRQVEIANRAKVMFKNPVDTRIENFGPIVNTKFPEYAPLIPGDESFLIFTSRRPGSTGGEVDPYGQYYEDIYIAYRDNRFWSDPVPLSANINTFTHDAGTGLSGDGNSLIIYRTNENLKEGDIHLTRFDGKEWSVPQKLSISINSAFNEPSACLNVDGNILFFSSDRPGGLGGKDIYRVVMFPTGEWSLPMNLGSVINTPYDEDACYFHPDGVSLFFSSKGHETMGGYDVFESRLKENAVNYTDTNWTNPRNLGFPVNTTGNDIYFVLSTDGRRGYYSSEREEGYGKQDIYTLYMPVLENRMLVILKGTVKSDSGTPLKAKMAMVSEDAGAQEGIFVSHAGTGKYLMILKPGVHYLLKISMPGFEDYEEKIIYDQIEKTFEVEKNVVLKGKQ